MLCFTWVWVRCVSFCIGLFILYVILRFFIVLVCNVCGYLVVVVLCFLVMMCMAMALSLLLYVYEGLALCTVGCVFVVFLHFGIDFAIRCYYIA